MTIRVPTLDAFTLTANETDTPRLSSILGAAVHSSRLVQALCWVLVFFL